MCGVGEIDTHTMSTPSYRRIGVHTPAIPASIKSHWGLILGLVLVGALAISALVVGAVALGNQHNGFSTPSLKVNQLHVGQQHPLEARRKARNTGDMTLIVDGSTSIVGNLQVEGSVLRSPSDCAGAGTTLTATKTAAGVWRRVDTYSWSVVKTASQLAANLTQGQCETLSFGAQAQRSLVSSVDHYQVTGQICITNGGAVSTQNLVLTDTLERNCGGGTGFLPFVGPVNVDTSSKPILAPSETWCYPYTVTVPSAPSTSCSYRNSVEISITNHAGYLPGCPGQCTDSSVPCPFGPNPKADYTVPTEPTVERIHELVKLTDVSTPLPGFLCSIFPTGDVLINDTENGCAFDEASGAGSCTFFKTVCNTDSACDTHYDLKDYIVLMSVNESTPVVVISNTITVDIYTGVCSTGCTLTIGYWKTHAGFTGNNADRITQYLPITLGCPNATAYAKGVIVTSAAQAQLIVSPNLLSGGASNGLNKVAAQLLAAKLNTANGASGASVAAGDAHLCNYGFNSGRWSSLSNSIKSQINAVATALDNYNNGLAGVAHCT